MVPEYLSTLVLYKLSLTQDSGTMKVKRWLLIQPKRKSRHHLKSQPMEVLAWTYISLPCENRMRRSGRASHSPNKRSSQVRFLSGLAHTTQSESGAVQRKHVPPSVAEQNCGNDAW